MAVIHVREIEGTCSLEQYCSKNQRINRKEKREMKEVETRSTRTGSGGMTCMNKSANKVFEKRN